MTQLNYKYTPVYSVKILWEFKNNLMWRAKKSARWSLGRKRVKPDQRISGGFRSNRSMMELKQCFFETWEEKSIFDILDVEYAPHRKNAADKSGG